MKNSITKFAITFALAFVTLGLNNLNASPVQTSDGTVVETIIIDGKIYPLVNLPAVEVSPDRNFKNNQFVKADLSLAISNSSKMVLVENHNGVYMPSMLLNEATVVASRVDKQAKVDFRSMVSSVFSFIYRNVAHFGVIQ